MSASAKPDTIAPVLTPGFYGRAEFGSHLPSNITILGDRVSGLGGLGRIALGHRWSVFSHWSLSTEAFAFAARRTLKYERLAIPELIASTVRVGSAVLVDYNFFEKYVIELGIEGRNRREITYIDIRRPANFRFDVQVRGSYALSENYTISLHVRRAIGGERTDFLMDPQTQISGGFTYRLR